MSNKTGSSKGKTKGKGSKKVKTSDMLSPSIPEVKEMLEEEGVVEIDEGPDVAGGLGGDVKKMLKEVPSLVVDGEELEQVFESTTEGGGEDESNQLLEPGPGEGLKPGDMTSLKEEVVRKKIPERTLQKMEKLILELRRWGNPTRAAQAAGITRSHAYNWRSIYPGFAKVWSMAMNMAIDDLETEARRRAFQGILKPAGWYKGKAGGRVREYSDNLLMFLLKAYRPDKFKDRIEATGAGVLGVKIQITDYSHTGPETVNKPPSTPDNEGKDQRNGEDEDAGLSHWEGPGHDIAVPDEDE